LGGQEPSSRNHRSGEETSSPRRLSINMLTDLVHVQVRAMFVEQVAWAKEEGVDVVIAETIGFLGEALLANEVIKVKHAQFLILTPHS